MIQTYLRLAFVPACKTLSIELDIVECGIDHALDVAEGDVELTQYPWVGVLFYTYCEFIRHPLSLKLQCRTKQWALLILPDEKRENSQLSIQKMFGFIFFSFFLLTCSKTETCWRLLASACYTF